MPELSFIAILITAIGLSADCFAVAVGFSIYNRRHSFRKEIRFPISFGIFQGAMMAIGWLAGRTVVDYISSYDHWAAFALLAFVGGRMIWESFHKKEEKERDMTRWWTLLVLSFATSIDSLGVGLSYAFLNVKIILASITTGLTAFVITIVGHLIGKKVGRYVEKWADIIGGTILIIIGVRIIITHLIS